MAGRGCGTIGVTGGGGRASVAASRAVADNVGDIR